MPEPLSPASVNFAGRYVVERELGRGATATVFLAHDTVYSRQVAIKVLRPELVQSLSADRFLKEIRLTAQLHHPNIVPVLDSGESDGRLYFVLPFMNGGTLRDLLRRESQLSLADAVKITCSIALALDYAHERGLIHRDVKPENILFTADQACLADFGIARALEPISGDLTTTGIIRGTPAYMSPEQAAGGRYDGRTDIYSLGCVLYEMVTGMMPFDGPTPQAVIAQRFQFSPRPVRAYRPSVPASLEAVIDRALMSAPADRFPSGRELADALSRLGDLSATASATSSQASVPRVARRRWAMVAVAAIAVVAVGLGVSRVVGRVSVANAAVDTTRIAVLPFQHAGVEAGAVPQHELLVEALMSRWHGVSVIDPFQVADAIARRGRPVETDADAREIARSVGAGRFIRGEVLRVGDSLRVRAALYDVRAKDALYAMTLRLPNALGASDSSYTRLADSLLLRGLSATRAASAQGTHSLPAMQTFAHALAALDDWDLVSADSLLSASIAFDPNYARAYAWLAQVRAWRQLTSWGAASGAPWLSFAQRAADHAANLSPREHDLVDALVLLGNGRFSDACRTYEELRRKNDRDFAAWYGLAQCRMLDAVVVADAHSATGWRFRSSYHQGVQALVRAFEILPSVHRGFEGGAFESLQALLFTHSTRFRLGYTANRDSLVFAAFPAWEGDTLVFHPVPLRELAVNMGASHESRERALREQRSVFHLIASSWSAALPNSVGAKQALAVSLDLLSDASAIDTLAAARRLAGDDATRLRLAVSELAMRFKFGIGGQRGDLSDVRALADSLLAAHVNASGPTAELLMPAAAMVGDCRRAIALARAGAQAELVPMRVPRHLVADARALAVASALGCGASPDAPSVDVVLSRVRTSPEIGSDRTLIEESMTMQATALAFPADSARLRTMTPSERSRMQRVIRAEASLVARDAASARREMDALRSNRDGSMSDGGWPPEFVLPETRVWLALRDTTMAATWADSAIAHLPMISTGTIRDNYPTTGAAVSLMALRADIAAAMKDRATARKWAQRVVTLWSAAVGRPKDVEIRMEALTK